MYPYFDSQGISRHGKNLCMAMAEMTAFDSDGCMVGYAGCLTAKACSPCSQGHSTPKSARAGYRNPNLLALGLDRGASILQRLQNTPMICTTPCDPKPAAYLIRAFDAHVKPCEAASTSSELHLKPDCLPGPGSSTDVALPPLFQDVQSFNQPCAASRGRSLKFGPRRPCTAPSPK